MSSVSNILKYVAQLQRLAKELETIAKQVTAESQLAQDARVREEEICEETRMFLERLWNQRKRSGSTNSTGTSSRKAVALLAEQGGGQIRVAVPPEKPEVTTPATAGVAFQGQSCDGGYAIYSLSQQKGTLSQVVGLLYQAKGPERREQEPQTNPGPCAVLETRGPPYKSQVAQQDSEPTMILGPESNNWYDQAGR